MSRTLAGFLIVLVAVGLSCAADTNRVAHPADKKAVTKSTSKSTTESEASMEEELKKLEEEDDRATDEVDVWIRQNEEFAMKGGAIPNPEMNERIHKRLASVEAAYEDFIRRHPNYAKARVAYASFLDDIGEEEREFEQLEKARELDPKDAATWNNLANYYGHNSPVKTAFAYYEKAISLDSSEPIYYHNFATTVYLFRKDAKEYYNINEQQVFDKAMDLYAKALKLDPTNFALATDVAMSYYGIRPLRTNDAFQAWTNALTIATNEVDREKVYIHFARLETMTGQYDAARSHLNSVTDATLDDLKRRLTRNLNEKESGTNSSSAEPGNELPQETNASPAEVKQPDAPPAPPHDH